MVIMEPVSFERLTVHSPPRQFVVKRPVTPIREYSPIEFLIENNGHAFIDLRQTRLQIKCKIVKPNGDAVTLDDQLALVNLPLQSLWRHVESYFQNKLVSSSDHMYPFKSMADVLLNYSEDSKKSQLQSQLTRTQHDLWMMQVEITVVTLVYLNVGWQQGMEKVWTWKEGTLYCDILQQKNLLLNNVPIRMKLTPLNAFVLMGEGRVIIEEARLWLCHVDLSPEVYNDLTKKLQKDTAKYSYKKSEFICHSMNAGSTSLRLENIFQGRIPTQIVIAFVDTDAFNGSPTKNPFNFKHHHLNYLDVNVNGRFLPRERPIEPDFTNKQFSDAFALLFVPFGCMIKAIIYQEKSFLMAILFTCWISEATRWVMSNWKPVFPNPCKIPPIYLYTPAFLTQ